MAIANGAAFQPVRATIMNDSPVSKLTLGTLVGLSSTYATGEGGSDSHLGSDTDQFQPGAEGYLGFKWTPVDGGGALYGWMRLRLTMNMEGAVIRDWAYDSSGNPIAAGMIAVPEPSDLVAVSLVFLGGFAVFRRMRPRLSYAKP